MTMVQTLDGPRLQHEEDQVRPGRLRTHMRPEQDHLLVAKDRIVISYFRIFQIGLLFLYKYQER